MEKMKPFTKLALVTGMAVGAGGIALSAHADTPPVHDIGTPVILRDPNLVHRYAVPMIARGEVAAVSNDVEHSVSGVSYLEMGDHIVNPEAFTKLQTGTYGNTEQFRQAVREIKGEDADVPRFNPTTQEGFIAVVAGENPSLGFDKVTEDDGTRTVNLIFSSTSVTYPYSPEGLSHYVIGITDKDTQLSITYKGAQEPFLTVSAPTRSR